jgi:hypothetical protein
MKAKNNEYTVEELTESLSTSPSNFSTLVRTWSKARFIQKKTTTDTTLSLPRPAELDVFDIVDFDEFVTFYVRRIYTDKESICDGDRNVLLAKLKNFPMSSSTDPISLDSYDHFDLKKSSSETTVCTHRDNCIHGCHLSTAKPRTILCGDCLLGVPCRNNVIEPLPLLVKTLRNKKLFGADGFVGTAKMSDTELEEVAIKYLLARAELIHTTQPLIERHPVAPASYCAASLSNKEKDLLKLGDEQVRHKFTHHFEMIRRYENDVRSLLEMDTDALNAFLALPKATEMYSKLSNALSEGAKFISEVPNFEIGKFSENFATLKNCVTDAQELCNDFKNNIDVVRKLASIKTEINAFFDKMDTDFVVSPKTIAECEKSIGLCKKGMRIVGNSWLFLKDLSSCFDSDVEAIAENLDVIEYDIYNKFYTSLNEVKERLISELKEKASNVAPSQSTTKPSKCEKLARKREKVTQKRDVILGRLYVAIFDANSEDELVKAVLRQKESLDTLDELDEEFDRVEEKLNERTHFNHITSKTTTTDSFFKF